MANGLIGKVAAGGGTHLIASTAYFTCTTAATTAAKIAKAADTGLNSLTVITGMTIYVKFTSANGIANPTLTLQTNGGTELLAAKSIMSYGTTAPSTSAASSWKAGAVVALVYDGTNWVEVSSMDNNTTYSVMSVAEMKTGTSVNNRSICASYLKSAFTDSDGIFKTGSTNGTISVYGTDIAVKGLGSRAYDSTSYLPLTGGTLTGPIAVSDGTGDNYTTLSYNSLIATGVDIELNPSEAGFTFDAANKVIEVTSNTTLYTNEIVAKTNSSQNILYLNSGATSWAGAINTGYGITVGSTSLANNAGPAVRVVAGTYDLGLHIGTGTTGNRGIFDWTTNNWLICRNESEQLVSGAHSPSAGAAIRHIMYGTGAPSDSTGSNGDVYLRYLD